MQTFKGSQSRPDLVIQTFWMHKQGLIWLSRLLKEAKQALIWLSRLFGEPIKT